jgi:hypothetical protein
VGQAKSKIGDLLVFIGQLSYSSVTEKSWLLAELFSIKEITILFNIKRALLSMRGSDGANEDH